eukprot:6176547-Pleurochrysis_carterae.AAC.1
MFPHACAFYSLSAPLILACTSKSHVTWQTADPVASLASLASVACPVRALLSVRASTAENVRAHACICLLTSSTTDVAVNHSASRYAALSGSTSLSLSRPYPLRLVLVLCRSYKTLIVSSSPTSPFRPCRGTLAYGHAGDTAKRGSRHIVLSEQ